ncbi:hypothetical protein EA58_16550 [Photobacterium galatheae]|uniref:Uncharacterized protein n=2 Tax=Photobacterium galatheae TaxID=1654360 RepID=A0A066RT17_9GAMM|nr:hypothetical protein EA58_16550 [Photobacterium galatheae]
MLQGCAGYVGGDLEDVIVDRYVDGCGDTPSSYQMKVSIDTGQDGGDDNIAGTISLYTLGLFPTYWLSHVESKVTIEHQGKTLYTREDTSRIHKFYGILWMIFLPESINSLRADEGGGIRVVEGIREKAVAKTLLELPDSVDADQLCVTYLNI